MLIIPAIDLLGGKVVRLEQGDYRKVKIYSEEPAEVAKAWKDKGAKLLHVVDLDGAREGEPKNLEAVSNIVKTTGMELELGGGIRKLEIIEKVFNIGVSKAILGTAAVNKRYFSEQCIAKYGGEKIVFSIDARRNDVLIEGWGLESGYTIYDLIKEFEKIGLKRIIYTDISRDGMMTGPNIESIKEILVATNLEVIASGGVSSIDDVKQLKALASEGLKGIIVGKALYEGKIDLEEAIRAN